MHLLIPHASGLADAARHVLRDLDLPNLASLMSLLTAAPPDAGEEATLTPPHERALAAAWGWMGADGALPFAARAAAADGIAVGDAAWGLVTPVHWHVGRDQVVLGDPAALALDDATSRALFEAVRGLFVEEGFRFEFGAATRWYVADDSLDGLATASLDRVINRPIEPWLRPDPQAADTSRRIRRLQSECQMVWYAQPLHESVNSFWLSGCGRAQPAPADAPRVDDTLRAPLLAEDWLGWRAAWEALDAGALADLARRARAGEAVVLTLCGERSAQRFEGRARSAWSRWTARFRSVAPAAVLEAL